MLTINATLVAIVLNFLILAFVLNKFLYKPVLNIIEERQRHIKTALGEADAKLSSAKAFMEEGKDSIAKANQSAKKIIDQASVAAEKNKKEALVQAKMEIEDQMMRAKHEIKQYKLEARRSLIKDVAKMSVSIAEKMILKKIDKKSQKMIVDKYIDNIRN